MPNTKISALTAGNPAQGTDEIPIARGASNFKVTAASIAALSPAGTVTSVGLSGGTTGITVSGTNPITSSGTLTLAGTLALANGGTGQTTKAAAFNALSPVTTTGDLIIGNGSNSNTRLPIGTNTYVLTSNGSTASWQPAAGGGGGVTSFDGGFTGLGPYSPTTGAVSLSGTLGVNYGGTGTGSSPSSGQLLIGTSFSSYQVANLTAGSGISITNSSGAITIAATGGGGGVAIETVSISTSSGSFNNSPSSSSTSKPLIGYNVSGPSSYGAFAFYNNTGGFLATSPALSSMTLVPTGGSPQNYTSGADFSSPTTLNVYDAIVTCYGFFISNSTMKATMAAGKAAITSPSFAPLDASSSGSSTNPVISVSTSGSTYTNSSGNRLGIVVNKSLSNYRISFASTDTISASPSVSSMSITINGSMSGYISGSDFSVLFANNSSNGMFEMLISSSNPTLTTLLNNSFL